MSRGGSQTQVSSTEPSALARPYYDEILRSAQNYFQNAQPFQGQTYAGLTPEQRTAQDMTLNYAGSLGNQTQQMSTANQQLLNNQYLSSAGAFLPSAASTYGNMLGWNPELSAGAPTMDAASRNALVGMLNPAGNPYLDQQVGRAQDSIRRQFTEQIMPGIRDEAIFTGQYGGSRPGITANYELEKAMNAMGNVATDMYGGAYNSDMNRMLQATGQLTQAQQQGIANQMQAAGAISNLYGTGLNAVSQGIGNMPTVANMGLMPAQLYGQVGAQNQAQEQARIQEEMMRYQFPQENINWYSALVGGLPLGSTQTQTTQGARPSTLSTVAGLGMMGYGLMSGNPFATVGGANQTFGGGANTGSVMYQQPVNYSAAPPNYLNMLRPF